MKTSIRIYANKDAKRRQQLLWWSNWVKDHSPFLWAWASMGPSPSHIAIWDIHPLQRSKPNMSSLFWLVDSEWDCFNGYESGSWTTPPMVWSPHGRASHLYVICCMLSLYSCIFLTDQSNKYYPKLVYVLPIACFTHGLPLIECLYTTYLLPKIIYSKRTDSYTNVILYTICLDAVSTYTGACMYIYIYIHTYTILYTICLNAVCTHNVYTFNIIR